jgi:hypothetical protein
MKDDIIYKHALTFSHEELAGMYSIINKREQEYLKEIEALKDKITSAFNAAYEAGALQALKGSEEIERLKKEVRIEGKAKSVAQELIKWHQYTYTELKKENARLREAFESIIELSLLGNDNQGKMVSLARQALKGSEE